MPTQKSTQEIATPDHGCVTPAVANWSSSHGSDLAPSGSAATLLQDWVNYVYLVRGRSNAAVEPRDTRCALTRPAPEYRHGTENEVSCG